MRFDAYAGNVRERELGEVGSVLAHALGGVLSRGRPVRRYGEVLRVELGGHCGVWVGRDTGNDCIYFEGKGESSPDLVGAVREFFPQHTVSRADVCEDYDAADAFERLQALVRLHKGPRVKGGYVNLSDDPEDGHTWAAGARSGPGCYLRLYEAGKMAERRHLARPHWVRAELEAKPHYAADKVAAARMPAAAFWGLSAWSHRVGEALCQVELPRYEVEAREYLPEKTKLYVARAFRRFFEGQLQEGRDWSCVGREFEDIWRQDDELARGLRRR